MFTQGSFICPVVWPLLRNNQWSTCWSITLDVFPRRAVWPDVPPADRSQQPTRGAAHRSGARRVPMWAGRRAMLTLGLHHDSCWNSRSRFLTRGSKAREPGRHQRVTIRRCGRSFARKDKYVQFEIQAETWLSSFCFPRWMFYLTHNHSFCFVSFCIMSFVQ